MESGHVHVTEVEYIMHALTQLGLSIAILRYGVARDSYCRSYFTNIDGSTAYISLSSPDILQISDKQ